jgi:undecaprenyl-phosphate galactose phosphotransferase/putative colanic acid biosynthesis UDP-glucose lipid carrier transferase
VKQGGLSLESDIARWSMTALFESNAKARIDRDFDLDVAVGQDGSSTAVRPRFRLPFSAIGHASALADALAVVVASLVGGAGYQIAVYQTSGHLGTLIGVGIVAALLQGLIGQTLALYQIRAILSFRKTVREIVGIWLAVSLLLTLLAFLMKVGAEFSRGSIVCFCVLALALVLCSRWLASRLAKFAVAADHLQGKRVILVGPPDEIAGIEDRILLRHFGLSVVDRVVVAGSSNAGAMLNQREAAALDRAILAGRRENAAEIVLAFSWWDGRKLELVRDHLRASPLPVQLLPDSRIRALIGNRSFRVNRTFAVEVQRGPLSMLEQYAKRILDIAGASAALVVLAPLFVLTAIAIKLESPGPVFFRQRRNGFNTSQFRIFKFRTMMVMDDGVVVLQARRNDPRVTWVGKILRQSSIDELPQLFNVLLGDMSLVGPRPHALAHDDQYSEVLSNYAFRNHVKPGITGWAQVNGYRGETIRLEQMKARVDCDLWYINNWDLLLDLKILALTAFEVVRRRNAY